MNTLNNGFKLLFFITFFWSSINTAQLKLSSSEIEKIQAKFEKKGNVQEFYFELDGKKIGPSIITNNGIYGYNYNKKGQKQGAQVYIKDQHIKVQMFKKGSRFGNGFDFSDGNLIYAKDFYKEYETNYARPFREEWLKQKGCMGSCSDGFGYMRYKSSKTDVLGFFKKSFPSGAVYVKNPRGSFYGSFKKGYRDGNGIVISKNKKEIRHTLFKKGKAFGLELYFYPTKEVAIANYRDSNGDIVKKYIIQNF